MDAPGTPTKPVVMSPQITTASPTAMTTPKKKSSSSSLFSLKCGCSDAKSVTVSTPGTGGSHKTTTSAALSGRHRSLSARFESSSADTLILTTATTSTSHDEEEEEEGQGTPSFSGLLRQLNELERSVLAWDRRRQPPSGWTEAPHETGEADDSRQVARKEHRQRRQKQRSHRRSQSEGDGGGHAAGKVRGSVAVVTETEDPLGEFRRSMLQMIVEEGMVRPEELQELLRRFLALNSPSHHRLIVRAFADVWRDVFSGHLDDVPSLVLATAALHPCCRLRRQYSYHGHHCY